MNKLTTSSNLNFASIAAQLNVTEDAVKAALNNTPVQPALASTKNLPTTGNNSAIFEQDFNVVEHEGKEILGQFFVNGIEVVWREASMIINPDAKGQSFRFFTKMESAGVLSSLSGIHTSRYGILEVGAHFFSAVKPRDFKNDRVGYMTFAYAGTNPELLRLRPEKGVNVIGIKNGAYVVVRNIPIMGYEHHGDEPRYVTENRQVYFKHIGMDLILSGKKILVSPTMYKNGEKSTENRALYLAQFAKGFMASPEEATQMYKDVVQAKEYKHHEAAVATKIKVGGLRVTDEQAFMSLEIPVGNGQILTVKDLIGKQVFKKMGNVRLNNSPITVSLDNVKTLVFMVQSKRNMELVLAG